MTAPTTSGGDAAARRADGSSATGRVGGPSPVGRLRPRGRMEAPDAVAVAALALPLALAAALAAAPPPAAAQAPGAADVERDCDLAETPARVPPVSALADSAELRAALSDLHPGELSSRYVVYSLRFGVRGDVKWMAQVDTDVPEALRDTLAATLSEHLVPMGTGEPWGVRVAMRLGPEPTMAVGRTRACPAVRADEDGAPDLRGRIAALSDRELRDLRRADAAGLSVRVGTEGEVRDVIVVRSSGSSLLDDWAREYVRSGRYLPALQDGVPVEAELRIEWGGDLDLTGSGP